jgi:uncharacterized RDD family membrane protein YckC
MSVVERLTVTGHYAGPASRAVAAALDAAAVLASYSLMYSVLTLLNHAFFGDRFDLSRSGVWGAITLALWGFLYVYVSLLIAGRTPGKGVVGVRVVTTQGAAIGGRAALIRTLVLPVSTLALGLGLVGIVLGRTHRALHDVAAGTCVVYDWGARSAQLPGPLSEFLARHGAGEPQPPLS